MFSLTGAVLAFASYYAHSSVCFQISQIFLGIQAGMSSVIVPIYLNEVSPISIRGACGVLHYLFFTIGFLSSHLVKILLQQTSQLPSLWKYFLTCSFVFSILGIILLVFVSEPPISLQISYHNEKSSRQGMQNNLNC